MAEYVEMPLTLARRLFPGFTEAARSHDVDLTETRLKVRFRRFGATLPDGGIPTEVEVALPGQFEFIR